MLEIKGGGSPNPKRVEGGWCAAQEDKESKRARWIEYVSYERFYNTANLRKIGELETMHLHTIIVCVPQAVNLLKYA